MSRNVKFIVNIIIVVLVIGLLVGGIYFLTKHKDGDSLGEMYTDDEVIKVFSYAGDELIGADVTNKYGSYSLVRGDNGWAMEGFDGVTLKATAVDTLVSTFQNITSEGRAAESPENLADFGLDAPNAVLTLTTTSGSRTFYIGNKTPDGSGCYFNTDASSDVYIMKSYMVDVINLVAKDYADIAAGLTAEDITGVAIDGPNGSLAVEMDPAGPKDQYSLLSYWNIVSPVRRSASNNDLTERLITPLTQTESHVSGILPINEENMASVGLNAPEYTITVKTRSGVTEYKVSASDGTYRWIRRSDVDYLMRTGADTWSILALTADDLEEKLLAMVDISLISEIHIEHKGETMNFDIVDGGGENAAFFKDGVELDADTFRDFYSHIVAINVSGSLEQPPDYSQSPTPVGSIEYVLTNGESLKLTFTGYDERNYWVSVNGQEDYTVAIKNVDKIFDDINSYFK